MNFGKPNSFSLCSNHNLDSKYEDYDEILSSIPCAEAIGSIIQVEIVESHHRLTALPKRYH